MRTRARGGGTKGRRKVPPLVNLAWSPPYFWDGRAFSLEEQALAPIADPAEMGNTHAAMVEALTAVKAYAPYFREAFGDEKVSKERVAKAIADYERTRLSGNSPWDVWRAKKDDRAVPPAARRGHDLFFGRAGCTECHKGDNFTDGQFHNLGVGYNPKRERFADDGRFEVTKQESDRGAFKTPTLREVARHPPYMHDGSLPTLKAVVEFYSRGGIENPNRDTELVAANLTPEEEDDLVAFLGTL